MHFFCAVLVLAIAPFTAESASCEERSSSGREFLVAVMEAWDNSYVTSININVFADRDGQLNVSIPFIHLTRTYHLKAGAITISVDTSIIASRNGTERKGILLESSVDVTVRVVIDEMNSGEQEGYLALPVRRDGPSSYVVASWEPYKSYNYRSEFLVASAADSTTVVITSFGTQQTVVLNRFDTYQMKYDHLDPSGTFIYATGPVSVLSGSQCSVVLFSNCQALVEQLVPVSSWGQSYITPALQSKHWNVIRVYTANDTATITILNSTLTKTFQIPRFNYTTIVYQDEPLSIQSDRPVQVMQYSTSYEDGRVGDPFMMTIPDVNSFLSEYKLKPLTNYNHDAHQSVYLTIIIDQTHETGLLLNGQSLTNIVKHTVVVTSGGNYSVITARLTADVEYVLRHKTPGVTFGALLYSYPDTFIAYGYPLGRKLRIEGCTTPSPPTTTPVPYTTTSLLPTSQTETTPMPPTTTPVPDTTTSLLPTRQTETTSMPPTTTPVPDTTTSVLPTSQTETTQSGHGLTCLACEDMTHVGVCDQVKRCRPHQVCFLEKYSISEGKIRFRSGCTSTVTCPVDHSGSGAGSSGCMHCCSSNYCNINGCGETGLPPLSSRGPICYTCNHAAAVEECDTVTLCYPGQVCRILRFEWGGLYSHYQMGCSEQQMCLTRASSVAYRSVPSCHRCCSGDFCNTSCNSTNHDGVSLIG